jgi:hypothetical protein
MTAVQSRVAQIGLIISISIPRCKLQKGKMRRECDAPIKPDHPTSCYSVQTQPGASRENADPRWLPSCEVASPVAVGWPQS